MSVPQIQEKINDIGKVIQERVSERIVEQIAHIPAPQILDETLEVIQLVPKERVSEHIVEEIADGRVP